MNPWLARLLDEAEARQLPSLIDEWERADDARRWIARALRIDLATSIERPELVMPALHRRLVRFGDDTEWFERTTPPKHAREAAALVAEWIAAWSPGQRWLRSMWPPPVALDAGVVAEYRTAVEGEVVFSPDNTRIGVIGKDSSVVWERATGRRLDGVAIERPGHTSDWELEERTAGKIVITSRERRIELAVAEYEEPTRFELASPEFMLVSGMDEDGYVWWVVDLERGRLIGAGWSVPRACAAAGDRCYVEVRDAIHAFDRDARIGTWSCPGARSLAVSADGLLATRSDHVIRVWDPDQAIRCGVKRKRDPSPATVHWSPDGAQLVSCGRLFDGQTGDRIAELGVADWSNAIEGAPASGYQCFTAVGFVEASHHGLRLWDREGRVQIDDTERTAWGSSNVAIDPTGRRFASYRSSLTVTMLGEGQTILDEAIELAGDWRDRRMGFTATGELRWELANGERWRLTTESSVPERTTDDVPHRRELMATRHERMIEAADGLLVIGDVVLPVDEPVSQAPNSPWYAGRASLIHLVT